MTDSKPSPSRSETAARIAAHPADFKVCEGCDSIVGRKTTLCPNCHSYRFDAAPERVMRQALLLGAREQTSVTVDDLF